MRREFANILFCVTGIIAITFSSCKKKEDTQDIIVEKVIEKPQRMVESMSGDERTGSVSWISGAEYFYSIIRKSDDTLPTVTNHDIEYYDNSVTLKVTRADGTSFFEKTFTKENFSPVLPDDFKSNGVLLGMNFDKAEGSNLLFTVSVGSPDENNEEFYYVTMTLNNLGGTSASEYKGN